MPNGLPPAITVATITVGDAVYPCPTWLEADLKVAFDHQQFSAQSKEFIDGVKSALEIEYPEGCRIELPGVCTATLAWRTSVKITDADILRRALPEALWDECVDEAVVQRPKDALLQIALDADNPLAAHLRPALTLATTTSLTLRPAKPGADHKPKKKTA